MATPTLNYMAPRTSVTLDDGGIIIRRNGDAECVEKCEEVELKHKRTWLQPHEMANPRPCISVVPDTPEVEKLCTIAECLEQLKTIITNIDPIANFDGNVVNLGKCTPDGREIIFCVKKDPDTGELISIDAFALTGSDWEPYDGECVDCAPKQYSFTGQVVSNIDSEYCGLPFVMCDNELMLFDASQTPPFIPIPEGTDVSTEFEPYVPGQAADICLEAQCSLFEVTPGMSGTVESIIAAMIVEKGLVYTPEGKAPIPVTPQDAVEFTIRRKPCNAETSDGSIVVADYVEIDGHKQIRWTDPKQGGVDLAVEVTIPETGCSLATVCFENCISKADYAALPAGEKAAEGAAEAPARG